MLLYMFARACVCTLPGEVRWYRCGDEGLHGLPVDLLEHEQDLWALQDQFTLTA